MTEYAASLEPVAFVLRLHAAGGGVGDPFDWSCTVVAEDGGRTAVLKGADRLCSLAGARAIKRALLAAGFTAARWERIKGERRYFQGLGECGGQEAS